jgi:vacuolar-type H+-ATPase subunit I/STV1
MVVDLTVRVNDEKKEFSVPSNLSIHTYGDYTISESKEAMISEVDGLLQTSKEVLDSVDKHKAAISSYEKILKTLNPVYAKESERDSRIDNLTQQMDSMQDTLVRLESLLRHGANGNN